jgi:hypothetical protein
MFRIRIVFNADPDPAFTSMQIRNRIHEGKPMLIHVDPDPGQTLPSQKVGF